MDGWTDGWMDKWITLALSQTPDERHVHIIRDVGDFPLNDGQLPTWPMLTYRKHFVLKFTYCRNT